MDQDSFHLDLTPFRGGLPSSSEQRGDEEDFTGTSSVPPVVPPPGSFSQFLSLSQARPTTQTPDRSVGRQEDLHYIWGTDIAEEIFRRDFRRYLETFEAPTANALGTSALGAVADTRNRTLSGSGSESVPLAGSGGLVSRTLSNLGNSHTHHRILYYIQELLHMYVEGRSSLELDMTWLQQSAPEMFIHTVNQPTECGQMMSAVVEEVYRELIASRYGLPVPDDVVLSVAPKRMPSTIALKDLSPQHIEKLLSLKGMVIRVSKVIPEVRVACFECWNCRYTERSACGDRGRIFEPTRCAQCGKSYTFKLQHNLSIFEDKQLVKIQESPENVSDGETPISISVVVYGNMVDAVIPGDRVIVTGIYRSVPIRLNANTRIIKSIFSTHMDALHVELLRSTRVVDSSGNAATRRSTTTSASATGPSPAGVPRISTSSSALQRGYSHSSETLGADQAENADHAHAHNRSHTTVDKDRLDMLYRIAHREDIYDILLHSFSRTIWGHEDVKRGILSQLFGGTPKKFVFSRSASAGGTNLVSSAGGRGVSDDGEADSADPFLGGDRAVVSSGSPASGGVATASNSASFRSELNVLLCGDPGVAKSQLLTQVHEVAPRGVYTSGKGSSSVGLTAFVVKDSDTGELVLEPGALVLSDQGLCCIDEFDKMNESTRSVLLEVMEQQTLSIAKAGIIAQLNARTSILAAANPKESQWNPALNVVENLQIESTLLSRFDLIFLLLDRHDPAEDRRLAAHVLRLYMDKSSSTSSNDRLQVARSRNSTTTEEDTTMDNNAAMPPGSPLHVPVVLELDGEVFLQGHDGDVHMPLPILSEYISVGREMVLPKLTKESHQQLATSYVELRRARGSTRTVSATLRQLESMIRLAEARAKMRFSATVSAEDVYEAKRLMSTALKEAATDPKTGLISLDMFHAPDPNKNSVEGNLQRLEALIRRQYIAAGKTTATVLELRHSFNEGMVGGLRPLSAGPFLELLALAAGGDVLQSFTATNVVFASPGKSTARSMPRIRPGMKKPPPGFDLISEKLDEFEELMKDAVQTPSLGVLSTSSQSQSQNAKRLRGESSSKSQIEETADDHEGGREERNDDELVPPLWRVAAINRERTRYVYDACFREKKITRELYDYCCEMQFIDGGLARRWQLSGYERLCCTACGVPGAASVAASMTTKLALRDKAGKKRGRNDDGHAETESTCICRVPASQRRTKHFTACTVCGCSGCCSSDV